MKRLFALMVVCAALVAVGCGERDTTTAPADGTTTTEPTTPPADQPPAEEAPADAPAGETGA